ncbi:MULTISPECIES: MFS transporter [Peribacillus]|uniref:MFS transporter n=1 Tax=Peribacillus TaxID=2675229 RepID=UPI001071230A|nr:MFS transporter [Peribacillus frigoritolerans]MEC0345105.1 MFS transporter [Peribacillus castrilensis]TFH62470.1 MFS transporter [Peribacillus frigoritolerans]
MNSQNNVLSGEIKKPLLPEYVLMSILTLFSFGPQYFTSLSYILNQMVIQNGLNLSTHVMLLPSICSNLAFSLGLPFGRILPMKYGTRKIYLTFIFIFLGGTIINILCWGIIPLTIGRSLQGLGAGVLFLTILPHSLRSYPNKVRNLFILFAIGGLFGCSAVGAFVGSLSLSISEWRWIFLLNILSSLICLVIGIRILPKTKPELNSGTTKHNMKGIFLFTLLILDLIFPLYNLQEHGFTSNQVWPFFVIALLLALLFIAVDFNAVDPFIPIRSLWSAKTVSGTIMALTAHIALIVAIAGANGFLRNILDPPFIYLTYFYLWFFIGFLASGIVCTLLYDKWGAGRLGMVGSIIIIMISIQWRSMGTEVSLTAINVQMACIGVGVSMVLLSGALGTALAGDIHKAVLRSSSLHSMRNLFGSIAGPVIGWFAYRMHAIHYEDVRGEISLLNPETNSEMAGLVRNYINNGHTLTEAKSMAYYSMVVNSQKGALLGAYHDLFTILLVLGIIMLLASIGKAVTGKGRSLVQKEQHILLPAPLEETNKKGKYV